VHLRTCKSWGAVEKENVAAADASFIFVRPAFLGRLYALLQQDLREPAGRRGGETTLEPLLNIARDNLPGEKTRPEGDKFKWKSATRRVDDARNKTRERCVPRRAGVLIIEIIATRIQHISRKFVMGRVCLGGAMCIVNELLCRCTRQLIQIYTNFLL